MILHKMVEGRKQDIQRRLNSGLPNDCSKPMFSANNINYELSERTRAIRYGGIGLIHKLARESGLIDAIDEKLHLLRIHLPYHESDHVLNIAYNALREGRCLEDVKLRRNDEAFLDALQTDRIPGPTTEGDFCQRFVSPYQIHQLRDAIDKARLKVWARQPKRFFEQAIFDADGRSPGHRRVENEEDEVRRKGVRLLPLHPLHHRWTSACPRHRSCPRPPGVGPIRQDAD